MLSFYTLLYLTNISDYVKYSLLKLNIYDKLWFKIIVVIFYIYPMSVWSKHDDNIPTSAFSNQCAAKFHDY